MPDSAVSSCRIAITNLFSALVAPSNLQTLLCNFYCFFLLFALLQRFFNDLCTAADKLPCSKLAASQELFGDAHSASACCLCTTNTFCLECMTAINKPSACRAATAVS
jgi:hypothetical protein